MSDILGLFWLVLLLAGNAFFVAAEFALMSARRSQVEPLAEAGNPRAIKALYAMENVSLMLACAQLGITVCSLLILLVAEPALHHLFEAPFHALHIDAAWISPVTLVLAIALVTMLHVILGEMIPKNIAVSLADRAVLLLGPALVSLAGWLKPVIAFLNASANALLKLLGVEPKEEVSSTFTKEELASIVEESRKDGLVEDDAGVIVSALNFSAHRAQDVMVPVEQLRTVEVGCTPHEFEQAVRETGFSRFPVEEEGELVGYLHLKDIMNIDESRYEEPITENRVRNLANLRDSDEIEDVLARMQITGAHMGRVLTEQAQTVGVIFLEDVLEVLIGEVDDATQSLRYRHTV